MLVICVSDLEIVSSDGYRQVQRHDSLFSPADSGSLFFRAHGFSFSSRCHLFAQYRYVVCSPRSFDLACVGFAFPQVHLRRSHLPLVNFSSAPPHLPQLHHSNKEYIQWLPKETSNFSAWRTPSLTSRVLGKSIARFHIIVL